MKATTDVYIAGSNEEGQLGHKSDDKQMLTRVVFRSNIKMIACGKDNSAYVTDGGALLVMGSNKHGKLGLGLPYEECARVFEPTVVTSLQGVTVLDVSLGKAHGLCACDSGRIYAWGRVQEGFPNFQDFSGLDSLPRPTAVHRIKDSFSQVKVVCGHY